jgi:general secretion pathway protein G
MQRKGFTLIELMIVIIILGLIASLVMPNLIGQSDDAKRKLVCIQMESLMSSLKTFKVYNGVYPTTSEGLDTLSKNPDSSKYASYPDGGFLDDGKQPIDPWKHRYIYLNNENKIELISLGADGQEGGNGEAMDIYYSKCNNR